MNSDTKILIITIGEEDGDNFKLAKTIQSNMNQFKIDSDIIDVRLCLSNLGNYSGYVFILPEWNGSYPGYFKIAIDNSGHPSILKEKPISIFGTSAGPFGNLIGVNHMTYILQHVGSNVQNKKTYIYNIKDNILNHDFLNKINGQIVDFVKKNWNYELQN